MSGTSRRILLNTAATYGRSVFAMGMALFSSRWVLEALGQSDFGLSAVVGSIIVFVVFLNNVLSASSSRFFAVSIGKGDSGETSRWFNASFSIHLCLALVLLSVGWPLGEYVVRHVLVIPGGRLTASLWVFRISLLSAFSSMVSVPFIAMFSARQRIAETAAWGMLQTTLVFVLAWSLRHAEFDRLVLYAAGMVGIAILVQAGQIARALALFPECRVRRSLWFDRGRLRELFGFGGWSLIGSSGVVLRDQGSSILLNTFFGPTLNAAYGIAIQVAAQTNQFAFAMIGAFNPEIASSLGRGERDRVLVLANMASKFGTILVLLITIPLMVEMETILRIWLHAPPPYAAAFCRLILLMFVLDRLTTGAMMAVYANGRIAGYQATVGVIFVATLPLAWVLLRQGLPPPAIGYAFLLTMAAGSLGRALWARRLFGVPLADWFREVLLPAALAGTPAAAAAIAIRQAMEPSLGRLVVVALASVASVTAATALFGMNAREKAFVLERLRPQVEKLRKLLG